MSERLPVMAPSVLLAQLPAASCVQPTRSPSSKSSSKIATGPDDCAPYVAATELVVPLVVAVATSAGAVQPAAAAKETVCAPAVRPVTTAPLARQAPPSTRHCAPAETASAGESVTFSALETTGAVPSCPFSRISSR